MLSKSDPAYHHSILMQEPRIMRKKDIKLQICREVKVRSTSDDQPLTTETAIFVKSHLKERLFSLPRGALEPQGPQKI